MNNPNVESFPGQILRAVNNRNRNRSSTHMMVYLSPSSIGDDFFEGAMLTSTTSSKYNNVVIPQEYFLKKDNHGNTFTFPTMPTGVRPRRQIKRNDWAPFHVVGQLSDEGIKLVTKSVGQGLATFNENNEFE